MINAQLNLDRLAAQHAQRIIRRAVENNIASNQIENTVTKALGVLQEDGVYACFLYLQAKEKKNAKVVVEEMLHLLDGLGFGWGVPTDNSKNIDTSTGAVLQHVTDKVTIDLERLLLAKETLEQLLIYARYGAKGEA